MGCAVVRIARALSMDVVCAVASTGVGRDIGDLAGVGAIGVPVVETLQGLEGANADVAIDFSAPAATEALASLASRCGVSIVSGTTGLTEEAKTALDRAAERVPVLWEPNMSIGVHVLARVVSQAASALADWDVEIVETHHHDKVDAPSGTALRLADAVNSGRSRASRLVHGREGKPGRRQSEELGMHALRGGDVIGDHVVHLFGGGERLELTHRATSREVFAHGALRAAQWLVGRPARRYSLGDVLDART
jgi:4-hydroxy-tetrahydrodipicolinate reductase